MDFRATAKRILSTSIPGDLFGTDVETEFKRLSLIVHPDRHKGEDQRLAHDAMAKLLELRRIAEGKIPAWKPITITIGKKTYVAETPIVSGDVADIYRSGTVILKVVQNAADNDLLVNESEVLRAFGKMDEVLSKYLPRFRDSFALRGKVNRRVNVLDFADGFITLADVKKAYPSGLDFRDVVWMFNRMLEGLSFIHEQKVVHGGLVPTNVMIHPINHGGKLIDWCYAVRSGHLRTRIEPFKDMYPPEVVKKERATPGLDIFMAAKCALWLVDGKQPSSVIRFWESCLLTNPARRPQDAGDLREEFDRLLLKVVGKPSYRKLEI